MTPKRFTPYTLQKAKKNLPSRSSNSNKTDGGKCLIIAGAKGYWGAAVLCAQAAARMGAGYTYILSPTQHPPVVGHPDFLFINRKKVNLAPDIISAVAIGPGLINHQFIVSTIKKLINAKHPSVVLDAEALNTLAKHKTIKPLKSWIMTPHEGELARLLGISSKKIKLNRKKYVELAQKKLGGTLVLKGHRTLITNGLIFYEIRSGNAALAKAGTGDVLTGLIVGLLSQGLPPIEAAALAAYIHGFIADHWVKSGKDHLSLLASDIEKNLPYIIRKIRGPRAKS